MRGVGASWTPGLEARLPTGSQRTDEELQEQPSKGDQATLGRLLCSALGPGHRLPVWARIRVDDERLQRGGGVQYHLPHHCPFW